jgi:hypothetical protein
MGCDKLFSLRCPVRLCDEELFGQVVELSSKRRRFEAVYCLAEPNDMSLPKLDPMAIAMEWVSRITVVALVMVLPGLAGDWLDHRWGTRFLALVGFGFGVCAAIWLLIRMTTPFQQQKK